MKRFVAIAFFEVALVCSFLSSVAQTTGTVDFFGVSVTVPTAPHLPVYDTVLSTQSAANFLQTLDSEALQPFSNALKEYRKSSTPDDWLYYQAVRKVAQYLSPKAAGYYRYTFYKFWLLRQSGYNVLMAYAGDYLLLYVQSDEAVYNIPYRVKNGKQYVCLNYHDYGSIDFANYTFEEVALTEVAGSQSFSYKVTHLPDFTQNDYTEKEIVFPYGQSEYRFRLKLNQQVKSIFTNYPVVDYELQCNMPLSTTTYQSLITPLKQLTHGLSVKHGVEALLQFTRYAFSFKPDSEVFGSEKRMSPEQTLLYEFSDCEDRAALFFYVVKEIYNLPMLVLTYPTHVTIAVQFDKPYGKTIEYNGMKYSICEPTPQKTNLRIGQSLPELKHQLYEIAYAYNPPIK